MLLIDIFVEILKLFCDHDLVVLKFVCKEWTLFTEKKLKSECAYHSIINELYQHYE